MSGPSITLQRRPAPEGAEPPDRPRGSYRLLGVHVLTAFWAAALVFAVQPMVAKLILPSLGGAPSVWLVSLVFFQGALLAGYGYAHLATRFLAPGGQLRLHLVVLAVGLVSLPIALPADWPPTSLPVTVWLAAVLLVTVGAPFVAAVATGPLLHRWYAGSTGPRARDPYVLFAAGNAGSLVALLAYPSLIEPSLALSTQTWAWSAGYAALIVLTLLCARPLAGPAAQPRPSTPTPARSLAGWERRASWKRRLRWVVHPLAASALLVAVTQHLTVDVAAVPLLWVIPLAVYLTTFIIAFSPRRAPIRTVSALLAGLAAVLAVTTHLELTLPTWAVFSLHLVLLGAGGLVAHTRLADERPPGEGATGYLLWIALGGALGGLLVAVAAPAILPYAVEYAIVVVAVLLARPVVGRGPDREAVLRAIVLAGAGWIAVIHVLPRALAGDGLLATAATVLAVAGGALVVLLVSARPVVYAALIASVLIPTALPDGSALLRERTFFGDLAVVTSAAGHHVLLHGTTDHGSQDPARPLEPISYYHPTTPLGQLMDRLDRDDRLRDVAVAGLGAGVLASHGREGQRFVFYEVDPTIVRIATDPRLFSYLADTAADVEIEIADARLGLAGAPSGSVDLIVLDAFTSNAIPVHLVTTEAIRDYLRVLRPDGLLAIHISNRYVDLEPVLAAAADRLGLAATARHDDGAHPDAARSHWVLLARDGAALPELEGWEPPTPSDLEPWTDDSSALWRVIDWR